MTTKLAALACTIVVAFTLRAIPRQHHVRLVTVEKLRQMLSTADKDDAALAQQLSDLKLTERLSAANLAALENNLPGPQVAYCA